jgi:hypothetical protein
MIFAVGQATHLDQPIHRWEMLGEQVSDDARWSASRLATSALSDAGVFGFGPGTFRVVFPAYNRAANNLLGGTFRFLHEDYLQTGMEWGWLGSALWALLLFGGMANAVLCLRRQTAFRRGQRSASGPEGPTPRWDIRGQRRSPESASLATASSSAGEQRLSPSRRLEGARGSVSESTQEWSWRRRLILPLTVVALAGVALHAAVDFPLQIASIQLYVATYLGLCWASVMWKGQSRK